MPNGMPMIKFKHIKVPTGKKVYFTSDHHFGLPAKISSREREVFFVNWLDDIRKDAYAVFILGDMFDFWYEYKLAVPKGFVRILGKLAELTDQGVQIFFFVGNHDMWMRDYLTTELNISVFFDPEIFIIDRQKFLIGHGDGLGPGDKTYKRLKKFFRNRIAQWAYRWLHPDIGLKFAKYLSQRNRLISGEYDQIFHGEEREWLFQYTKQFVKKQPDVKYFVFGHRHLPLQMSVSPDSTYFNTGDWLYHFTYIVYENEKLELKKFDTDMMLSKYK